MNAFSPPGAESTSAALRRVEAERDDYQEHLVAMQIQRDAARAEAEQLRVEYGQARDALEREKERRPTPHLDTVKAERDLARAELARVEEAAGRDINARDQGIVDRVADLLRGRTEATQRALELAAELASARTELDAVRQRLAVTGGERDRAREAARVADRRLSIADKVRDEWLAELDALRTTRDRLDSENAALRQESQALQALLQSPTTTAIRSEGAPPE